MSASAEETEQRLLTAFTALPELWSNRPIWPRRWRRRRAGIPRQESAIDSISSSNGCAPEDQPRNWCQQQRHCDGGRMPAAGHDDFWLAISRLRVWKSISFGPQHRPGGHFDLDHARKVLAAFGTAFGKLRICPAKRARAEEF